MSKPKFSRSDAHKKPKLGDRWRKPRGLHNKKRLRKKGYGRAVGTGYGTKADERGSHKSGLEIIRVTRKEELANLDSKKQGVIISGKISMRNRAEIIREAQKKEIKILNLNPENYLKKVEEKMKLREEKKKELEDKKKEKEKEAKKEKKEEELSEEEKKKKEKEEKDKVLRTKEA